MKGEPSITKAIYIRDLTETWEGGKENSKKAEMRETKERRMDVEGGKE